MTGNAAPSTLPRLLYAGDVPVESTVAGSALLYRLLATWPAERLRIVESSLSIRSPEKRLRGIQYRTLRGGFKRLMHTRFASWYAGRLLRAARRGGGRVLKAAGDFPAEAILTVAHGSTWRAADDAARRLRVPLHLIVHDDPVATTMAQPSKASEAKAAFAEVYRRAATRLCVSPYMAEAYEKEFGVAGDVIYPCRAPGSPVFDAPPERLTETARPLTYGYAGSVNSRAYAERLSALAALIGQRGERLLVFSNLASEAEERLGLTAPHVQMHPVIPFQELMDVLRGRVDALYVPMSFEPADRTNMEISFPSKLTDYTAVGLPLLIQGPEYCSAVRWARASPGAAEVVTECSAEVLAAGMSELADPARRLELAQSAIRLGREFFSHDVVFEKFAALLSSPQGREAAHGK